MPTTATIEGLRKFSLQEIIKGLRKLSSEIPSPGRIVKNSRAAAGKCLAIVTVPLVSTAFEVVTERDGDLARRTLIIRKSCTVGAEIVRQTRLGL